MTGPVVTIFPLRLYIYPEHECPRVARVEGFDFKWKHTSVQNACHLIEKWLKKERKKQNVK